MCCKTLAIFTFGSEAPGFLRPAVAADALQAKGNLTMTNWVGTKTGKDIQCKCETEGALFSNVFRRFLLVRRLLLLQQGSLGDIHPLAVWRTCMTHVNDCLACRCCGFWISNTSAPPDPSCASVNVFINQFPRGFPTCLVCSCSNTTCFIGPGPDLICVLVP